VVLEEAMRMPDQMSRQSHLSTNKRKNRHRESQETKETAEIAVFPVIW
jgi:hypothetical protein